MSELNQSAHNREDDLESFFHVLNWMALRYTSHTLDSQMLTYDLQRIYDASYKLPDGRAAGGRTKLDALLSGRSIKGAQFQNLPLVRLLKNVRKLAALQYQDESDGETDSAGIDRPRSLVNQIQKRHVFTALFTKALTCYQDWGENGGKVDHKVVDLNARTEKKRKSEIPALYQVAHLPAPKDSDEHPAKRLKQTG